MKKANIFINSLSASLRNIILIETLSDILLAHEAVYLSKFDNNIRASLESIKKLEDIYPELEKTIKRYKFMTGYSKICLVEQIKNILNGKKIVMNFNGNYFAFASSDVGSVEMLVG